MITMINRSVLPGDDETYVWPGNDDYGDKQMCLAR